MWNMAKVSAQNILTKNYKERKPNLLPIDPAGSEMHFLPANCLDLHQHTLCGGEDNVHSLGIIE